MKSEMKAYYYQKKTAAFPMPTFILFFLLKREVCTGPHPQRVHKSLFRRAKHSHPRHFSLLPFCAVWWKQLHFVWSWCPRAQQGARIQGQKRLDTKAFYHSSRHSIQDLAHFLSASLFFRLLLHFYPADAIFIPKHKHQKISPFLFLRA